MKKSLFCILLIAAFVPLTARTAREDEIIGEIRNFGSSLKDLSCDFIQTKEVSLLEGKTVSYGRMYYSQPGLLRWEYTSPYQYTFVLNGNTAIVGTDSQKSVVDVNRNSMFREIARLIMNSIVGKNLTDPSSFGISVSEAGGEWIAALTPLKKSAKQLWTGLVIHFNPRTKTAASIEMNEQNGDRTVIVFKNVKTDAGIGADLFSIQQ